MIYIVSACLFFVLSVVLGVAIWHLPVWCQSWTITSTWGIACTGLYVMLIYPESVPYVQFMGICFLGAFPGMLALEFYQRRARVWYWESKGLPEQLQGKPIFWSHHYLTEWIGYKLDEWALDRVQRRLERDRKGAIEEAERLVNGRQ